ncbi:hypothetical protein DM02DRAFT_246900 [Periconia macrospinosa]|uniref:SUN domain-containing protein n=1 Tax=Periconia macrospinosa TaxID=97972 RepID=A0A2V1DZP8_9PLEO|nr:hypothetical protein DM02DRAFT_246900 [Periconia macrospinosa]
MSQAANRQGAPTPRRSARISQSAASRSVVSVETGVSATPGKSKTTLPKLKSRQSTAYGASGRVGDAEELEIPVTGFSQAFQVQRDAALAREEPSMSGAATNNNQHSPTPIPNGARAPSEQQDYESEEPPTDDEDEQQPEDLPTEESSAANTTKSFGLMRESGMMHAPSPAMYLPAAHRARLPASAVVSPLRPEPRTAPVQSIPHTASQARSHNASRFAQPPQRRSPRSPAVQPTLPIPTRPAQNTEENKPWFQRSWLPYLFYALLAALLAVYISNTEVYESNVKSLKRKIHEATWAPPTRIHDRTFDTMYEWLRTRDNVHTEELAGMQTELGGVSDTLKRLETRLPEVVAVTKLPDGSVKVDDDFWRALQGKMKKEGFHGISDIDWDSFLESNAEKLTAVWTNSFDASKPHPYAVNRKEVTKLLEDNWHKMSALVDKKIAEAVKTMEKDLKTVVTRQVERASLDKIRLQSLAAANLVTNMELSLKKVNYFSQGLGATIDTDVTSPTQVENLAWASRFYRRIMVIPDRRPPTAALAKWDEPGDCWCAPPDTKRDGKVQLGVHLPSRIFPDQLTIEHIPMTAVPGKDISNAPQNVELWVKSDKPAIPRPGSSHNCESEGPRGWICLGTVTYDIRGANHVQIFDLKAQTQDPIDHAFVRITKNWGADHTCLYRVRLHGAYDGPDHDYQATE